MWHVPESLSDTLEQLVLQGSHVERRGSGGGDYKRKTVFLSTQEKVNQNSVIIKLIVYFDNTQETTTDYSQGIIATTYLQFSILSTPI